MRFYIVFLVVSIFSYVHAQNWRTLDSLCYEYAETNPDSAIIYGKKAIEGCIKEKGKNSVEYAVCLEHTGIAYINKNMTVISDSLYNTAKSIIEKLGKSNSNEYVSILNQIGSLYRVKGMYSEAELYHNQAINILLQTDVKDSLLYVYSLNNLAGDYLGQSRYSEATDLCIKSIKIRERLVGRKHIDYASACNNLAGLYKIQGMYSKAEILFKESINIIKEIYGKNHPDYILYVNNLAGVYEKQGNYTKAQVLLEEAIKLQLNNFGKSHKTYIHICGSLAGVYEKQKIYEKAESLYKEVIMITENIFGKTHPTYAMFLNNLAGFYYKKGKYEDALLYYKKSLDIYSKKLGINHESYARVSNNMAVVCEYTGKYTEAETLLTNSLKIREKLLGKFHPSYGLTCVNLARYYHNRGFMEKSEMLFKEVLDNKNYEIQTNFVGLSHADKEIYFQHNIESSFYQFMAFVMKRYIDNPSITQEAYENILNTKGIILENTEKIKNRILNSGNEELKKMYLEWKKRKDEYVKAQNLTIEQRRQKGINLDSLNNQINELEKELSLKSEDFANAFTPKTVTWKDIQNTLKKDQAAIEILQVNAKQKLNDKDSILYMALIVKKNSIYPEIVVLPNGNELESKYITNYRRSTQSKMPDELSYNAFWKPIKEKLKGIKTVYLSPDGVYHQINLNTLQNPDTKKYVIDEVQVINVTNTKDILNKHTYTTKNNYLIGNPKFDLEIKTEQDNEKPKQERTFEGFFEGISQLEGAENEVKQISTILPNAKTITGTEATEEYIKSIKNPRILHIATHGYFRKGQYQSSTQAMLNAGLLFSGVVDYDRMEIRPLDKEDGKLTAFEVMNMELDSTELVVLSACETGLGQVSKEGVYGLQRAFKVAGAECIIMSLWRVSDEATQLLMTKFYENWQKKGMDKRKAFETAQKEIRKQYKEPYYWGAFVMIE